jgi:hypothetical protein
MYITISTWGTMAGSAGRQTSPPPSPTSCKVAQGTTAGVSSVDGFITNTANYGPTKEPFLTANEVIGGTPVFNSAFYQFNPNIDEEDYAAQFDAALISAGFPSTLGFLIDTSRNGWGGPNRPTGPSTSTVLNTFVDATKIDSATTWASGATSKIRDSAFRRRRTPVFHQSVCLRLDQAAGRIGWQLSRKRIQRCNFNHGRSELRSGPQQCAGQQYVDGRDTELTARGHLLDSRIPDTGTERFPPIPATTAAGFTVSAPGVTVEQGTTATDSVTVSSINGFNSPISLSVSGLPAGVSASFSPASVTGSAGTTLTFVASNTATVGAATSPLLQRAERPHPAPP